MGGAEHFHLYELHHEFVCPTVQYVGVDPYKRIESRVENFIIIIHDACMCFH